MTKFVSIFFLVASILFTGCTTLEQIRTDYGAAQLNSTDQSSEMLLQHCSSDKKGVFIERNIKNVIEDYQNHLIGYVEYTDQGWEYNSGLQRHTILKRLNKDLEDPSYSKNIFVNIVFVHGWHHNAEDGDCNVNEFRAMVHDVSKNLNDAARGAGIAFRYRINGIYVGWRGESSTMPLLRQLTLFSRRTAAEHIAKGSVRELFADLRALEYNERSRENKPNDRVRTIVVGHSFGGLIAFHSLSQALINDLAVDKKTKVLLPDGSTKCVSTPGTPRLWPDFTVLINPAFEASRFEAVHNASLEAIPPCVQRPKLIVVTSDTDQATGTAFPIFRSISSIFEKYDPTTAESYDNERLANLHAVGFIARYKTHRLELNKNNSMRCVNQFRDPTAGKKFNERNPVWVVGVPSEIVSGHSGFLYPDRVAGHYEPYLLNWLVNVYLDSVIEDSQFHRVYENYKQHNCVDKGKENEVIKQVSSFD